MARSSRDPAFARRSTTRILLLDSRRRDHLHWWRADSRCQVAAGKEGQAAKTFRIARDLALVCHGRKLRSLLGDSRLHVETALAITTAPGRAPEICAMAPIDAPSTGCTSRPSGRCDRCVVFRARTATSFPRFHSHAGPTPGLSRLQLLRF